MNYQIRLITQEDNKALSDVIKRTLEEIGCAMDGTVYTDEATDHMYDGYQDDRSVYYIAESEEGEVLGGSGIAPIPNQENNYCELQRMFLSTNARGLGIGTALMSKCIDFAKEAKYDLIYLETFDEMHDARKLYQRSGFEYVDYALGDTGHFSCEVKMIMPLNEKRK
jgi:putative acetyltransferase